MISQFADVELIGCSISEHQEGGIMILSDKSNKVIIDSCPIYDNRKFGAHFMGHDGQAMITK